MILNEILLYVTGSLWTQLSAGAAQATNLRFREVPALLTGVPSSKEHLFGAEIALTLQRELDSRKQAGR